MRLGFERRIVHRRAFISRGEQVHAYVLMPNHLHPKTEIEFTEGSGGNEERRLSAENRAVRNNPRGEKFIPLLVRSLRLLLSNELRNSGFIWWSRRPSQIWSPG